MLSILWQVSEIRAYTAQLRGSSGLENADELQFAAV